jgi:hypothetical protein
MGNCGIGQSLDLGPAAIWAMLDIGRGQDKTRQGYRGSYSSVEIRPMTAATFFLSVAWTVPIFITNCIKVNSLLLTLTLPSLRFEPPNPTNNVSTYLAIRRIHSKILALGCTSIST